MKNLYLTLIKRIYLIRRLDSIFCLISLVISAILVFKLSDNLAINTSSLTFFPLTYLFLELLLLFSYKRIKKLRKSNQLDYFRINRKRLIVLNLNDKSKLKIGNLRYFLSLYPVYFDVKLLITSKLMGLIIAIMLLVSILVNTNSGYSLILLILASALIFIKPENEAPRKLSDKYLKKFS